MARFDRCGICDYSEADGAPAIGVSPGRYGKVRWTGTEHLCDSCIVSVVETVKEYEPVEGDEDTSTVPTSS